MMNRFKFMWTTVLSGLLCWSCMAQEKQPQALQLEQGIFAEETEGNLDKALSIYEAIVKEASASRPIAAEALYRLGVCCLKQSQAKQAQAKECLETLIKNYSDVGDFAAKGRKALDQPNSEAQGQAIAPGQIDKAKWESDLLAIQDHNTMAFDVAKRLVTIEPDAGFAIVDSVWSRLPNEKVKQGVLKAFEFSRHPRVLDVLHLGATDPSMEVRNYAFSYLCNYSYKDFAEDSKAYETWHSEFTGHAVDEVLKTNSERFVAELKTLEGPQREIMARFMRELDLGGGDKKTSYPNKRQYLLDAGILPILDGWIQAPGASDDVIDGVFSAFRSLKPDDGYVREKIFPLMDSENARLKSAVMSFLGQAKVEWAVLPLIKRLSETKDRSSLWSIATSLGELGDARAIPAMIAVIEADNTYDTVYGVGYFGLGKLTGVRYDPSHDGKWWREWWSKNKDQFPEAAQSAELDPMLVPNLKMASPYMVPDNWAYWNSDENHAFEKMDSADSGVSWFLLSSNKEDVEGKGKVRQFVPVEPFRGCRIRISALMKGEGVKDSAGMYVCVTTADGQVLIPDGVRNRFSGDLAETKYEIVVDILPESEKISTGFVIFGPGKLWFRDVKVEIVGSDVPVTVTTRQPSTSQLEPLVVPPDQWGLAGSNPSEYEKGTEENGCYLRSKNPGAQQFGTLTRSMSADPYRGKRLRLTASIKGEGLQSGSGMWLRVDDPNGKIVAFDNMGDRLLMGDVVEKTCEVVLDVPQEGVKILYGVFLAEKGCVHVRDMKLETVGTDVAVTGKKP